jgi:hypothetical protein
LILFVSCILGVLGEFLNILLTFWSGRKKSSKLFFDLFFTLYLSSPRSFGVILWRYVTHLSIVVFKLTAWPGASFQNRSYWDSSQLCSVLGYQKTPCLRTNWYYVNWQIKRVFYMWEQLKIELYTPIPFLLWHPIYVPVGGRRGDKWQFL